MSTEKEQTTMSTIHPIHPTLQFEAKHAMRFLDNLLQSSTSIIDMPRTCFDAIPVFATGLDLKEDFVTLTGNIGKYEFTWKDNLLVALSSNQIRPGYRNDYFEANFDDTHCDFLYKIWELRLPEARECIRATVSRLAKAVSSFAPSKIGGVAERFKTLVHDYRLTAKEANILLLGLCVSHDLLEYGLSMLTCCSKNFLIKVEWVAAYVGYSVDDIMPLVRNDSILMASGLLEEYLFPSREILMYLEGHTVGSEIKASHANSSDNDDDDWDALFE